MYQQLISRLFLISSINQLLYHGSRKKNYWENRYNNNETGWDIGYLSTPLKDYIDQLVAVAATSTATATTSSSSSTSEANKSTIKNVDFEPLIGYYNVSRTVVTRPDDNPVGGKWTRGREKNDITTNDDDDDDDSKKRKKKKKFITIKNLAIATKKNTTNLKY